MKKFKHVFFVISSNDYEKISEGKPVEEFLPATSPLSMVLRHDTELRIWFRADAITDIESFRNKLKNIPYQWGEDRDKLQKKD